MDAVGKVEVSTFFLDGGLGGLEHTEPRRESFMRGLTFIFLPPHRKKRVSSGGPGCSDV